MQISGPCRIFYKARLLCGFPLLDCQVYASYRFYFFSHSSLKMPACRMILIMRSTEMSSGCGFGIVSTNSPLIM